MKEYRDAELGSLVGRAEDHAPLDTGLEARIWGRLAEQPRRRRWPWLVLILAVFLIAGAVFWRWTPPRGRTMNEIRAVVLSRTMLEQPQPPAGATPGRRLTKAQKASVAALTTDRLRQVLTPEEYARMMAHTHLPKLIAGSLSELAASAGGFPVVWKNAGAGGQLGDLSFVRRNPNGSIVVRVVQWDRTLWGGGNGPFYTQEYTLKKVDGSWRIASERDLGLWPDGTLNEDLGG
jgi:hypothetical protein